MPELISAGKVYRAVPPLFGIKQRNDMKYFTTKLDFTKYVQTLFAHNHILTDLNGRKLTNSEVTNLFFKNIDYKDSIDFISNTFAIDPDLLESVLYYLAKYVEVGDPEAVASMAAKVKVVETAKKAAAKKPTTSTAATKKTTSSSASSTTKKKSTTTTTAKPKKKEELPSSSDEDELSLDDIPITEGSVSSTVSYYIKPTFNINSFRTELRKSYRFIDVTKEKDVIRIEGLVNSKYQYVFINDKFISACINLILMIKNNIDLFYRVDNEVVSLYSLMCKFDSSIPAGLIRYKGLGEQNPEQLAVSALHPSGDRTLVRYTIESAKEEVETFRRIDSNMASLLRDLKITKADIE